MRKLDLVQMEDLQAGESDFDKCMNSTLSKWQVQFALAAGTVLGGLAGLAGGMAGLATYCYRNT